ncbi:hypothetical protein KY289_016456 [Solanum tuberosum]|nr:hypothetical protein KY289_016456 [Solanum tuberosum]
MMKNKIKVEKYIGWRINSGSFSFWWDDWLGVGALANYTTSVSSLNNATIAHFLVDGKWNERKLRQQGVKDSAIWKQTEAGTFTCASAWEICRTKKAITLPANWSEVVESIERCNQETRVILVMWKTPPPNRYKLNTDGSALHNPGKIGGGGILRDEQGIIIFAFAIPLGEGTNNQA